MPPTYRRVLVVGLGGPLAGKPEESGYNPGAAPIQSLLDSMGQLPGVEIYYVQFWNKSSADITTFDLIHLSRFLTAVAEGKHRDPLRVIYSLNNNQRITEPFTVDGFSIWVGSCTGLIVAFFMHLTVCTRKPITFTKPPQSLPCEQKWWQNLRGSVVVSQSPDSENKPVMWVEGRRIFTAAYTAEVRPQEMPSFDALSKGIMGYILFDEKETNFLKTQGDVLPKGRFSNYAQISSHLPNVPIITAQPDDGDEQIFDGLHIFDIANTSPGIILQGLSHASWPKRKHAQIQKLAESRFVVACHGAPLCRTGPNTPGVPETIIPAGALGIHQACLLLRLCIATRIDPREQFKEFDPYRE